MDSGGKRDLPIALCVNSEGIKDSDPGDGKSLRVRRLLQRVLLRKGRFFTLSSTLSFYAALQACSGSASLVLETQAE